MVACSDSTVKIARFILPGCENTFADGVCTAAGEACYETPETCKDKCNYSCQAKEYWFSDCALNTSFPFPYLQIIDNLSITPPKPEFGKAFSQRGYGSITLCDVTQNDRVYDPYWQTRDVIEVCGSNMPGTFLGRWIARQKWFEGHRVEIYTGLTTDTLAEMRREIYYIESRTGTPGRVDGKVTFKLQDPLMLLKDAKCPSTTERIVATEVTNLISRAPFTLGTILTSEIPEEGSTTPGPYDAVGQPMMSLNYVQSAEQDLYFSEIQYIRIDQEIMKVRPQINFATPTGWNFILLERAVCGTTLADHKSGAAIVAAVSFTTRHVGDAVRHLLEKCGKIEELAEACCDTGPCLIEPAEFSEYQCENPYHIITGPVVLSSTTEDLEKILEEMACSFGFMLHFDNRLGRVRMVTDKPPGPDVLVRTIDRCKIINPVQQLKVKPISAFSFKHTPSDWSASLSASNMTVTTKAQTVDSLNEPCKRLKLKIEKEETKVTRFFNAENEFIAQVVSERRLDALECGVYGLTFDMPRRLSKQYTALEYTTISADFNQDVGGLPTDNLWRILSIGDGSDGCERLELESTNYDAKTVPCFTCEGENPTVILEQPDLACNIPEDCVSVH